MSLRPAVFAIFAGLLSSPGCAFAASAGWIRGLDDALRPGGVVIIGEMHGTVEGPELLMALVRRALARGVRVGVGLEVPVSAVDDVAIERGRTAPDVFWLRAFQDGRSTRAMFALVRQLHTLGIPLLGLDVAPSAEPGARDEAMAQATIDEVKTYPDRLLIELVGNLHSVRGSHAMAWGFRPMADIVDESLGQGAVTTVQMQWMAGSAWICTDSCGVHSLGSTAARRGRFVAASHSRYGYDFDISLGHIRSSPPIRAYWRQIDERGDAE